MSLLVNVQGGTNAGKKKPLAFPLTWTCRCGVTMSAYGCGRCGDRRPKNPNEG